VAETANYLKDDCESCNTSPGMYVLVGMSMYIVHAKTSNKLVVILEK